MLLFIGFITPRKGLEYLAQALHRLPANVHLVIAGRWAPHYRTRFLQEVGTARERVHEVGFLADWERPFYYSMADLYVSPSILAGLGITPIEALACETPAIVTSAALGRKKLGRQVWLSHPLTHPRLPRPFSRSWRIANGAARWAN